MRCGFPDIRNGRESRGPAGIYVVKCKTLLSNPMERGGLVNRRRWIGLLFICGLALLGKLAYVYKYYLWPKRFAVVEAGQIYRGGSQKRYQLRAILKRYRIKT